MRNSKFQKEADFRREIMNIFGTEEVESLKEYAILHGYDECAEISTENITWGEYEFLKDIRAFYKAYYYANRKAPELLKKYGIDEESNVYEDKTMDFIHEVMNLECNWAIA